MNMRAFNDPAHPTPAALPDRELYAMAAEFRDVNDLMSAAEKLRDAGFLKWDVHSPFPIHGMDKAMGIRPTILPWITLVHGLVGLAAGLLLVWWTNATSFSGVPTELQGYPFLISGKPTFSLPANIPIIFELGILLAAFGTVLGLFGLNKLPMLYNPVFQSEGFRGVTSDRFYVVVEAGDPMFEEGLVREVFNALGAASIERITERDDLL
jgi:hypothetical protein